MRSPPLSICLSTTAICYAGIGYGQTAPEREAIKPADDAERMATATLVEMSEVPFDTKNRTAICVSCVQSEGTGAACGLSFREAGTNKERESLLLFRRDDPPPESMGQFVPLLASRLRARDFVALRRVPPAEKGPTMLPDSPMGASWAGRKVVITGPQGKVVYVVPASKPYKAKITDVFFNPTVSVLVLYVRYDPGGQYSAGFDEISGCRVLSLTPNSK